MFGDGCENRGGVPCRFSRGGLSAYCFIFVDIATQAVELSTTQESSVMTGLMRSQAAAEDALSEPKRAHPSRRSSGTNVL